MSSALQDLPVPAGARLRLRCANVHPVGCAVELRGDTFDELTARTRDHGATAHGFTSAWYTPQRIAAISASATLR